MILKNLSQKVLTIRKRLGILQGAIARATGINQAIICQIENGKTIDMGADAFHRLARALGVTMEFLLDDDRRFPPRKQDEIIAGRSYASWRLVSCRRRSWNWENNFCPTARCLFSEERNRESNPVERADSWGAKLYCGCLE